MQTLRETAHRILYHPATTAFGATTILLLLLLAPLASPLHTEFYHLYGPVSTVLWPVLINFAGVWLLLTVLLVWGQRSPWLNTCLWIALGVVLPWMLLKVCFSLSYERPVPRWANLALAAVLVIVAALLLAFRSHAAELLHHAGKLGVTMLSFVAISGVVLLAEATWFSSQAGQLNAPRPLHQPAVSAGAAGQSRSHGRIVWIILDELSYRQVYEHRYPGLQLPAFDQLAAESTVFTHTVPAGMFTDLVLPSLITGVSTDKISAAPAGAPLWMRNAATHAWQQFDPQHTVFQDALNAGYSTAIAGWYNPYCRILPTVLDQCYWISHVALPGGMYPGQTIGWNARQPIWHFAEALHLTPRLVGVRTNTALHQQDYRGLLAAGDEMLSNPSLTFILLHIPIPHLDGIYNRRTASFAVSHGTYIDNLALCDIYIAHVRQELERNGSWDSTTMVLMGDHSWRMGPTWFQAPEWTPEEQAASDGGKFDDRPAYIVKLPQQKTAARIDTPFAALRTRELFNQLFTGRITTPQQLKSWAQQGD